jgi:phosphate transport system substrate-binding protein
VIKVYVFLFGFLLSNVVNAVETQTLRIHGSNTIGAILAPELVKTWLIQKRYKIISDRITAKEERKIVGNKPGHSIEVEIYAHGSSTSFRDFASGNTDVGMASRRIKKEEIQELSALGQMDSKQSEYVIALDGLPIIVHPSNPLTQLTKDTVQKIFSGKITNWSQLGLAAGKINIYARDNNSGTYDTFKHLVLSKDAPLSKMAKRFESNTILSDDVAKDINGIGFVGMAYVRHAKVLAIADTGARAMKPARFTVSTEDYALSRRLFMYIPQKNPKALAKEFVNFAVSKTADAIVDKVGFVSQEINSYKATLPDDAPEEYRQMVMGAERLSINIRFKEGSISLDNKAMRDVERIEKFLAQPENVSRRLMLFGFADKTEVSPFVSHSFSVSRADAVADYLLKNKIYPIRVRGYGQQIPVANNLTQHGRYANRRVEIWMM